MSIAFVTGNAKKFAEAQRIIPDLTRLELDLPEIQSLDSRAIIEAKVKAARAHHAGPLIVDDVSFGMSALNGFPGPLIKWLLESVGTRGIWRIASSMEDTRVRAVCTIGFAQGDEVHYFTGEADGEIVEPRGPGFGWDPIFLPDGETRTYAEMTVEEKNERSSRGMAFAELKTYLKSAR